MSRRSADQSQTRTTAKAVRTVTSRDGLTPARGSQIQLELLPAGLDLLGVLEPPLGVGQVLHVLVRLGGRELAEPVLRQERLEIRAVAGVGDDIGGHGLVFGGAPLG